MANATIRGAVSIHGTNPQFLIEKPVRARIYESPFWKEHCFALSAATILPLATSLHHIGGLVGLQRPSHFLCLLQKLLQIQPEPAIVSAYLGARQFKYLRALAAFYVRLTYKSTDIYTLLEPLLEDGRKLRRRGSGGEFSIVHMDEWIDMLLTEERVCDIILPRLTRRDVCETRDGLPPRISKLETSLLKAVQQRERDGAENSGSDDSDDSSADVKRWKLQRLQQSARLASSKTESAAENVYNGAEEVYTSQEESDDEGGAVDKRRRFISPSPSVSPDRQLPASLARTGEEEEGYVSRSPSRSPDRDGCVSRSPSRSPDRLGVEEEGQLASEEGGYISRSPSRSPDRV
ncbi:related to PRP38A-pre-mRNA-splicing factor [Sporisorium reilianum f. sp. reilianum]|uniref:Pre-mRNA-splicing factor 38 n=1 Tax=Sporisorium reilianum f. sp. reilianum TaxID=72559 RepID=A0A2N8UIR6_9BASI|nr:related to PRP38A-pre-mRNA-splicing factor [Sporisorium reilianum f. sp. reilianum]